MAESRRYAESHEWVQVDGDVATVGISEHAVEELGEVVPFDLPPVGKMLTKGDPMGDIESVKAVSELYAPLSGEIVAANIALTDAPELVNSSPLDEGWIVKIRMTDASELDGLMSQAEYDEFLTKAS